MNFFKKENFVSEMGNGWTYVPGYKIERNHENIIEVNHSINLKLITAACPKFKKKLSMKSKSSGGISILTIDFLSEVVRMVA